MNPRMKFYPTLFVLLFAGIFLLPAASFGQQFKALVFSKTQGFRHQSVPEGVAAIKKLASKHRFQVYATEDASLFTEKGLADYDVIIMMSTTGNIFNDEQKALVDEHAKKIEESLKLQGIRVKYDHDDKQKPGWKFAEYELKGIPIRIGIGTRDLENNQVEIARRDNLTKELVDLKNVNQLIPELLIDIGESYLYRMEEEEYKPRVNLRQYQKPKAGKAYLARIVFYIVALSALIYFVFNRMQNRQVTKTPSEISVEIEAE